jgi:hypothetical protein
MLRSLMADGRSEDVVSLVSKLVENNTELAVRSAQLTTRNVELEKQLEKLLARVKKNETVSKAQLVLFADAIRRGEAGDVLAEGDPRADANEQLRDKSGIDDEQEPQTKPVRERPTGPNPRRQICHASRTRSVSRRTSARARAAARSACALATTPPRRSI